MQLAKMFSFRVHKEFYVLIFFGLVILQHGSFQFSGGSSPLCVFNNISWKYI